MTRTSLLLAAAGAALLSSPATARPMTATDMHSMHRMGAPDVSPDGKTAVFTLSDTDWTKNKRVNRVYQFDLTPRARCRFRLPVPRRAMTRCSPATGPCGS